ncbi:antitoxin [Actinomadura kijaniata]|uniref:antitoxin n=1 Tax=Actinomadura kijaniata TaxID=46161 RepID=UPI003F1CAA9C
MSFADKVKGMLGQHSDKAEQGVEKAGDMLDERTGGKHADKVDMAQDKARDYIEGARPGDQARPADPNQPPQ